MARKPMVTRTIQATKIVALCCDIESGECFNKDATLPRTYKDEKHLMPAVEAALNTPTCKAVHVVHTEVCETLYGMDEAEFIKHATVLPPRVKVSSDEA